MRNLNILIVAAIALGCTAVVESVSAKEHSPPGLVVTVDVGQLAELRPAADFKLVASCAYEETLVLPVAEAATMIQGVPSVYAAEIYVRRLPDSKARLCTSNRSNTLKEVHYCISVHGSAADLGDWCS